MAKKRRAVRRPEIIWRNVKITAISARVGIDAEHPRGEEPTIENRPWLELRGSLEEPVKGVEDVLFSLYPGDDVRVGTARPAAVGSIIGLKPEMSVVVRWPHRDFDRLWTLALSGKLSYAYLCFTKPHYRKALVVSSSFSTEREE